MEDQTTQAMNTRRCSKDCGNEATKCADCDQNVDNHGGNHEPNPLCEGCKTPEKDCTCETAMRSES